MKTSRQLFYDLLHTIEHHSQDNSLTIKDVSLFIMAWEAKMLGIGTQPLWDALELVSVHMGVSVEDMVSKSRKRPIVEARAIFYQYCRDMCDATLEDIAEIVGKNHATIIHSLKNIEYWGDLREKYRIFVQTKL